MTQLEFKEGNVYIIDVGMANAGEVTIVELYPNGFALVKDVNDFFEYEWTVRLCRLTALPLKVTHK